MYRPWFSEFYFLNIFLSLPPIGVVTSKETGLKQASIFCLILLCFFFFLSFLSNLESNKSEKIFFFNRAKVLMVKQVQEAYLPFVRASKAVFPEPQQWMGSQCTYRAFSAQKHQISINTSLDCVVLKCSIPNLAVSVANLSFVKMSFACTYVRMLHNFSNSPKYSPSLCTTY